MVDIVFSYPYSGNTEAHVKGCKAAHRRVAKVQTEVRDGPSLEGLVAMRLNPDEGYVKIHACLAKAAKAEGVEIPEQVVL